MTIDNDGEFNTHHRERLETGVSISSKVAQKVQEIGKGRKWMSESDRQESK
jgi:hypothetical protein